jgi:serine/threonine-protein kinase
MQCPTCQAQIDEARRFCPSCGGAIPSGSDTQQAQDPMLGATLGGKYKVIRLLGEGGMGAVYEGEQQLGTTKRKVAVKTLHPHLSRDPKIKARFEREVGTIAELEHPNTIQVYDFGTTEDGILYIVMEFLHGKSLADLLEKEGAMPPERVAYIFNQVCGSLEEAHGRNIVHRDLKPDNIVLVERAGKKDFVKVLDFGIAKRSKEEDKNEQKLTQQGMVLGTPPYMSPEQFTGRPIDVRSDIYSLAVMAFEMLTGKLPFQAETAWEWATQHMTQPPMPIETFPEGMRAPESMRGAIRRALEKSPDARFQTVHEFNEAFGAQIAFDARGPMTSVPSMPDRPRTDMSQPLGIAPAYGGPPMGTQPPMGTPLPMGTQPPMGTPLPMGPPMGAPPGYGPPPHTYTPEGGNVAYSTPGIPAPPPRPARRGGGAVILVVAGLIGVASVIAIVIALRPSPSSHDPKLDHPAATSPAPPTSITTTAPTVTTPPTVETAQPTQPTQPTHPVPPIPSPHPTPPPSTAHYDGPECARARQLRGLGPANAKEAQKWALACSARGGNPN